MSGLPHYIEVMYDSFGFVMTQKNCAVGRLNTNASIAPDVGAKIADAANAVAAQWIPGGNRVLGDLFAGIDRKRKPSVRDLDSCVGENVMEAAPGPGRTPREESR